MSANEDMYGGAAEARRASPPSEWVPARPASPGCSTSLTTPPCVEENTGGSSVNGGSGRAATAVLDGAGGARRALLDGRRASTCAFTGGSAGTAGGAGQAGGPGTTVRSYSGYGGGSRGSGDRGGDSSGGRAASAALAGGGGALRARLGGARARSGSGSGPDGGAGTAGGAGAAGRGDRGDGRGRGGNGGSCGNNGSGRDASAALDGDSGAHRALLGGGFLHDGAGTGGDADNTGGAGTGLRGSGGDDRGCGGHGVRCGVGYSGHAAAAVLDGGGSARCARLDGRLPDFASFDDGAWERGSVFGGRRARVAAARCIHSGGGLSGNGSGASPRRRTHPPYGNRCRKKPRSTARTQTRWAANGTGIRIGSIAL